MIVIDDLALTPPFRKLKILQPLKLLQIFSEASIPPSNKEVEVEWTL